MPAANPAPTAVTTSLEQAVAVALGRATARIQLQVEQALKGLGLTLTQHNALRILNGAGPGGLCGTEIAARMISAVPDMTRLLDRLADAGLVERERDPENRRFVTARITEAGRERVAAAIPVLDALHREQFKGLSEGQLRTLLELLQLARGPA